MWWKWPPTHVKWPGANYWISRCMAWVYGSRVEEGRWQKANTLWWARASVFTVAWSTSTSNSSFLWMGTLQRTTRLQQICQCLDAPPCSYPVARSQCELLLFEWAWSSFFPFAYDQLHISNRIFQVCTAPSSCGNWMLTTLQRTFMVLLPGWWV